jgi:hypothetical protein
VKVTPDGIFTGELNPPEACTSCTGGATNSSDDSVVSIAESPPHAVKASAATIASAAARNLKSLLIFSSHNLAQKSPAPNVLILLNKEVLQLPLPLFITLYKNGPSRLPLLPIFEFKYSK